MLNITNYVNLTRDCWTITTKTKYIYWFTLFKCKFEVLCICQSIQIFLIFVIWNILPHYIYLISMVIYGYLVMIRLKLHNVV